MKKKYSYVFEGKVFYEPDAYGLLLDELKGKPIMEQLSIWGIRFVIVDNEVDEYGYFRSIHNPYSEGCFCRTIPGLRVKDFSPREHNSMIGINLQKHRRVGFKSAIDWAELCSTLAHEMVHTRQFDARNFRKRDYKKIGYLSVAKKDRADEKICDNFSDPWLRQDNNFAEAKKFLQAHRHHGDFSRIFPTHVMTFTSG